MWRGIRSHFGTILLVSALVSVVLGTWGFLSFAEAGGLPVALYRSVQLFYWNYFPWNTSVEATLPWSLEVARWLAPLTMLGAIFQVAVAVFQRQWNRFRARRLTGHAVICGAGRKGTVLAKDLEERGRQVVLIESDPDRAEALEAEGFLVVCGDATKASVLAQAGTAKAAQVAVTTSDDEHNLIISMAAAEFGMPSVHAHGNRASLCDLYWRHRAQDAPAASGAPVRVFSEARNIARQTIRDFAPESGEGEVHVVLPGLCCLGRALTFEYALLGHFTDDRRVHLHLVGPSASLDLAMFMRQFPGSTQCMDLDAMDLVDEEHFSRQVAALLAATPGRFTIFPALAEGNRGYSRTLELLEQTSDRSDLRILLTAPSDSPLRSMVSRHRRLNDRIGFLPQPEDVCGYEAVIGESLDRTARTIHEKWIQETHKQIAEARASGNETLARSLESKATFRPWEELSEEQKGASRSQADHIPFKVRAAGWEPGTITKAQWDSLTPPQIERLSRMEHKRWEAYYWMTGWTFAPQRNDAAKQHPNLVAYDLLDEPTKDYDRAVVLHVGDFLA
jgi:hypothetical protein